MAIDSSGTPLSSKERWLRSLPLGYYPQPAPFTLGSKFIDTNHPGHRFTVWRRESHFGDESLFDISGRWHDLMSCRVVEYLSPEALEQRKQDRILERLGRAYDLAH